MYVWANVDEWNHILASASFSAQRRHHTAALQAVSSQHGPENAFPQRSTQALHAVCVCVMLTHFHMMFLTATLRISLSYLRPTGWRSAGWQSADVIIHYHNEVKECLKTRLQCVYSMTEQRWCVTKNLTSRVIQVELYLLSSHCDSGNILFKHWRRILLFLRHIRNFFDEYILVQWPLLIF